MLLASTQPALAPWSPSFEMTVVLVFLRPGFLQEKDAYCLQNLWKSPKDRLQNRLLHVKVSLWSVCLHKLYHFFIKMREKNHKAEISDKKQVMTIPLLSELNKNHMTLPFQHSAEFQMTVPLLLVSRSICIVSYLQTYLDIEKRC